MLDCLRHHAIVGRHHKQNEVDTRGTGEHVAHEALVTRNIDEAKHAAVRGGQIGKAKIDRNPA